MNLENKTIVVTGAAQGIGRALSSAFAQAESENTIAEVLQPQGGHR
jgi:NAD(P)-dependent dehydrogenase (short-subunit alcohol dehydrogenase family)